MYIRPFYTIVRERLLEPKNKMQVIAGPRQVGKSTLVEQVCRSLEFPSFVFNADAALLLPGRMAFRLKHSFKWI